MVYTTLIPMSYFTSKEKEGIKLLTQFNTETAIDDSNGLLFEFSVQRRNRDDSKIDLLFRQIKVELLVMSQYPNIHLKYKIIEQENS